MKIMSGPPSSGGQNDDFRPLNLWPHRFPHFGYINLGGGGVGGALILDRCRAYDLFASVDAHLCLQVKGFLAVSGHVNQDLKRQHSVALKVALHDT